MRSVRQPTKRGGWRRHRVPCHGSRWARRTRTFLAIRPFKPVPRRPEETKVPCSRAVLLQLRVPDYRPVLRDYLDRATAPRLGAYVMSGQPTQKGVGAFSGLDADATIDGLHAVETGR